MDSPRPDHSAIVGETLMLSVLNGFQVRVGQLAVQIAKEKAGALLALLVISAPHRCSRAVLRGLLWSDSDESAAQNSLRNTLWVLRNQLQQHGHFGLGANRSEIWIDPATFTTDLDSHEACLGTDHIPGALFPEQGFPDQILSGFKITDLFDQRIETFRAAALRRIRQRCAAQLTDCLPDQRIGLLSLLTALEPANESHCRMLMSEMSRLGRKAEALAVYQKLWNYLETEFGEEPSPETQSVILALKEFTEAPPGASEGKPVLVLTPAAAMSSEGKAAIFVTSLHELALSALARFREWRIIDGRFHPDMANLLHQSNGLVCTLSIVVSDPLAPQVRAAAILTDTATGQVLWSEPLHVDADLQALDLEAAARRLAMAMNLFLTGPLRPSAKLVPAGPGQMYDRWIDAQHLMRQFTQESWNRAEVQLDTILRDHPGFVRGLASRASIETMRQIAFPGISSTPDLHRKALKWANAATLADPMDSRAQLALAWACAMSRQFDRAEIAFELAFQNNENDPWTITSALVGFAFCNRLARAGMLMSHVQDLRLSLAPVHWSYMAAAKFLAGDDRGCVEMSERAAECSADVPAWHAAALGHLHKRTQARAVGARFLGLARENWSHPHPPKDVEIAAWLLGCFPIRSRAQWSRLRRGLVLAGLPVPGQ